MIAHERNRKIAREGIKNEQSPDAIRARISAEDEVMRKLAGFLKSHPIYAKTVLENSVKGFIDFAETSS